MQLTLDELLRAVTTARTGLVGLENLSDEELARLQQQFLRLRDLNDQGDVEATPASDG